jgi:serine/threonine-protein kinase
VLERRIAVGGSSDVFLARPAEGALPAPRLVIKRPHDRLGVENEYPLLEREAELHRAVAHPNVVTVYSAGMADGQPYLAMEYVEGVDLYRLLRYVEAESVRLPVPLAVYVARRVAHALQTVHTARGRDAAPLYIVHRDVTPSNVYLSKTGEVKLGDFGIARSRERTSPGKPGEGLKGKFGYLAPEQVAGLPFDHRADLFALAAVLGEMLIGERVFPGSGQLAVLLAIRDANLEPLERARAELPKGLFEICRKGLGRQPEQRYQSAAEFAKALAPFELPTAEAVRLELGEWVARAQDSSGIARKLEGQIRDSMRRMRAVQRATDADYEQRPTAPPPGGGVTQIKRVNGQRLDDVPFPQLVEMIATGDLRGDDQVSLYPGEFRAIRDVEELARHLLPSSTARTGLLFEPGIPDYQATLRDTSMLEVLARMRMRRETGGLFIERRDQTGGVRVKEIYLKDGRLLHVASSERAELLGEYLVRRGVLERKQLELALKRITMYGGKLGDTLIALGIVSAIDVFHAIRDQGRDRVATLCSWPRGAVGFYRGSQPSRVDFPLDLDLASPIMAGTIIRSQGDPRTLLPDGTARIVPGGRAELIADATERGTAPSSLQAIPKFMASRPTLDELLATMTTPRSGGDGRAISAKEACAAIAAAKFLDWIAFD